MVQCGYLHRYLQGRRKVIKDEPKKVNWEQMIKVITSSLGKEIQRPSSKAAGQLNSQMCVFKFRIFREV